MLKHYRLTVKLWNKNMKLSQSLQTNSLFLLDCDLQVCPVKKANGSKNHHCPFWTPHGIDYLTKACWFINNKNHSGEEYRQSIKLSHTTDCVVPRCPIASWKLPTSLHLHITLRKRGHDLMFATCASWVVDSSPARQNQGWAHFTCELRALQGMKGQRVAGKSYLPFSSNLPHKLLNNPWRISIFDSPVVWSVSQWTS